MPRLEAAAAAKLEQQKEEMLGKLKELGNGILGKFGMSLDNFKARLDPNSEPTPSPLTLTLNLQPSTLNPQPSTLNPQPSTLNPQPSTLNPQPSPLPSP